MKDKGRFSRLLSLSAAGVLVVLLILTAIWSGHQKQLDQLHASIGAGRIAVEKMDLIAQLIETARARTRLTNQMAYVEDYFEKDEINLDLDRYATRFAQLRQSLLALGISEQEEAILEAQVPVIRETLSFQRRAAELIMSDDADSLRDGKRMLMEQVYPSQGVIIDYFLQLLSLQKQVINEASLATEQQYEVNRKTENMLFIILLLFLVGAAVLAFRRLILVSHFEHEASYDPLTGMLNRRVFEKDVRRALALSSRDRRHVMGIIDLDRFKVVNDMAGHSAGDRLLIELSANIKAEFRKRDLFARIGGDEFAFFLFDTGLADASGIAEKMLTAVRDYKLEWKGDDFQVGASIGLVPVGPADKSYASLYQRADNACYQAKRAGKNRVYIEGTPSASEGERIRRTAV